MAVIVDSGAFITLERRRQSWHDVLYAQTNDDVLVIAAITASELLAGVLGADTPTRRATREAHVEDILEGLPSFPSTSRLPVFMPGFAGTCQ